MYYVEVWIILVDREDFLGNKTEGEYVFSVGTEEQAKEFIKGVCDAHCSGVLKGTVTEDTDSSMTVELCCSTIKYYYKPEIITTPNVTEL